jgi:hypothetical protein
MVSWLLLLVFGIIWAAFLLPTWRRSPTSTVEDFEQRMSLLAEANKATPGRWVLVPKKGHRFLGPQDRQRARLRRRRKSVFVALLELTGLTLIMGLFQPLRPMLLLTALLCGVIVLYVAMLLRLRSVELAQGATGRATYANGNGIGYQEYPSEPRQHVVNGNGTGYGVVDEGYLPAFRYLMEGGVQIMDEDVHVIVRRSDEVDLQALRAANGDSAP